MITNQLLRPASIVVVGASNNVHKPGGAILRNLINGGYTGELRAVNPKEAEVQGVTAYADVRIFRIRTWQYLPYRHLFVRMR